MKFEPSRLLLPTYPPNSHSLSTPFVPYPPPAVKACTLGGLRLYLGSPVSLAAATSIPSPTSQLASGNQGRRSWHHRPSLDLSSRFSLLDPPTTASSLQNVHLLCLVHSTLSTTIALQISEKICHLVRTTALTATGYIARVRQSQTLLSKRCSFSSFRLRAFWVGEVFFPSSFRPLHQGSILSLPRNIFDCEYTVLYLTTRLDKAVRPRKSHSTNPGLSASPRRLPPAAAYAYPGPPTLQLEKPALSIKSAYQESECGGRGYKIISRRSRREEFHDT